VCSSDPGRRETFGARRVERDPLTKPLRQQRAPLRGRKNGNATIRHRAVEPNCPQPDNFVSRGSRPRRDPRSTECPHRDIRRDVEPVEQVAPVQALVHDRYERPHAAGAQIDVAVEHRGRGDRVHRQRGRGPSSSERKRCAEVIPGTAAIAARWPRYHESHSGMRDGSPRPLSLVKIID